MTLKFNIRCKENIVVDALSRVQGAELLTMAVSILSFDLIELLKASYVLDDHLMELITQLQQVSSVGHYTYAWVVKEKEQARSRT